MMAEHRFADAARRAAHLASMVLGWRPAEFWAATPAELATALGLDAQPAAGPADATMLARMMEQFPDEP